MRRRYAFGPGIDEPILQDEGGALACTGTRFLGTDAQGSVIAQADCSGNRTAVNAYDEYGVPKSSNQGRFQYTGQAWLPEAGLYYYKARMYSPALGRFMQTDPIGYGNRMNAYAYVGNNPVNATDPTGLYDCNNRTIYDLPCLSRPSSGSTTTSSSPSKSSGSFSIIGTIANFLDSLFGGDSNIPAPLQQPAPKPDRPQIDIRPQCPIGVKMISLSTSLEIPFLPKWTAVSAGIGVAIEPTGNIAFPVYGFAGAGKGASQAVTVNYSSSNAKTFSDFGGLFYEAGGLLGAGFGGGLARFSGAGGVSGTTYSVGEVSGRSVAGGASYTDIGPTFESGVCIPN